MTVLLFARAKDLIGAERIEVAEAATVGELRQRMIAQFPKLAGLLEHSAFAINDEIADDTQAIPADGEVALLPPVSGG